MTKKSTSLLSNPVMKSNEKCFHPDEGDMVSVWVCLEDFCTDVCERVYLSGQSEWRYLSCGHLGDSIVLYTDGQYMSLCQIEVYGHEYQ